MSVLWMCMKSTRSTTRQKSQRGKHKKKHPNKPNTSKAKFAPRSTTITKIIGEGLFYAEVNDYFKKEFSDDGYDGVEIRHAPGRTEIIIRSERPKNVLGDKGKRIREITNVIRSRYQMKNIECFAERVMFRGLSARLQAESLKFKIMHGLDLRRAAYGVLRFVMENEAIGCQILIRGRTQEKERAKLFKFQDGLMIHSGDQINYYVDRAVSYVTLRRGTIGIQIRILLPFDPTGKKGPKKLMSDKILILNPRKPLKLPLSPTYTKFTPLY